MDTGFNPRNLVRDEPIAATPGVSGETGLRFPRSGRPDNADPVEGAPTWVTYAVDAIKKGGRRRSLSFRT